MTIPKFNDFHMMNIAIKTANTGIGETGSNPSVGCCIVMEDGELIAKARTGLNGRPHAENIALEMAGERSKNSTMYVTLEPCSHKGDTEPCVDSIINSGIKRIFIATKDPDERVNGGGIKALSESGIEVITDVCRDDAMLVNSGYFYRKLYNRPFITLKLATTLDGKIAAANGHSKWITSAQARKFANKFRSTSDAILIGKETLKNDNPFLDCTLPGTENHTTKKIILDSKGDINDPELNIFKKGEVWSFGAENNFNHENFKNFPIQTENNKVNIQSFVSKLAELGINNLLVEGGRKIATSLLKANLVDKIVWFRSSKIGGNDAISCFGDLNFEDVNEFYHFINMRRETLKIGDNTMEILMKQPIFKTNNNEENN